MHSGSARRLLAAKAFVDALFPAKPRLADATSCSAASALRLWGSSPAAQPAGQTIGRTEQLLPRGSSCLNRTHQLWTTAVTDVPRGSRTLQNAASEARIQRQAAWDVHREKLPRRFASNGPGQTRPHITPAIAAQLERIKARHSHLTKRLSGEVSISVDEMQSASKEVAGLAPAVQALARLEGARGEVSQLEALAEEAAAGNDEEMRRMALDEARTISSQLPALEETLLMQLIPKDDADERGVVLEVRAGTGGEEASLFASELLHMYQRYAELQRWKFEIVELAGSAEQGGCKSGSVTISGTGIYGRLKFESGIHRVQRVPVTESGGRVHTSAATIAVMPQAEAGDVEMREEDLRIETMRASGAGGQHVNTTNSAVRITHLPSGLTVAIQDERSQHKNKAKALKVLRARLYEQERRRRESQQNRERKGLIGSGDRSERIRTYNFPQGRVTDHRVGMTEHNIQQVLAGEALDGFIDALLLQHQSSQLANLDQL